MQRSLSSSLVLLALAAGCGGTTNPADTGTPAVDGGVDAASAVDSGNVEVDGGGGGDTGVRADTGVTTDTGVVADAGPTDQCTNTADMALATMASTPSDVADCGTSTFGAEPGLMNCIAGLGFTAGCASCYDAEVHCVIAHCIAAGCATDPGGASCTACRNEMCHPAFASCSGLP